VLLFDLFDRYCAAKASVPRLPYSAHPACADERFRKGQVEFWLSRPSRDSRSEGAPAHRLRFGIHDNTASQFTFHSDMPADLFGWSRTSSRSPPVLTGLNAT